MEYTDNGEECKNKCEKAGESYNWCYKISGSWDYCTPTQNEGNLKIFNHVEVESNHIFVDWVWGTVVAGWNVGANQRKLTEVLKLLSATFPN